MVTKRDTKVTYIGMWVGILLIIGGVALKIWLDDYSEARKQHVYQKTFVAVSKNPLTGKQKVFYGNRSYNLPEQFPTNVVINICRTRLIDNLLETGNNEANIVADKGRKVHVTLEYNVFKKDWLLHESFTPKQNANQVVTSIFVTLLIFSGTVLVLIGGVLKFISD